MCETSSTQRTPFSFNLRFFYQNRQPLLFSNIEKKVFARAQRRVASSRIEPGIFCIPNSLLRSAVTSHDETDYSYSRVRNQRLSACPRQAKIALAKLFFDLTCPTGKLTKYSVLTKIKQDYLKMQFRSAFVGIK